MSFDDAATLELPAWDDVLADVIEAGDAAPQGPRIPVGTYLALVTGVEPKENANTGSVGYNWSLAVNTSRDVTAWDTDGQQETLNNYTYLGKRVDGVVQPAEKIFNLVNMLRALNAKAGDRPENLVGRIIKVTIKHEPSYNDPSQLFSVVGKTFQFVDAVSGEVAPRLAGSTGDKPF